MDTSDLSHHISSRFNEELERVRSKVLRMGGLVEEQLQQAVRALVEADSNLGEQVARRDVEVNALEVSIDEDCSRILATRSPAASDLRLIVAIMGRLGSHGGGKRRICNRFLVREFIIGEVGRIGNLYRRRRRKEIVQSHRVLRRHCR